MDPNELRKAAAILRLWRGQTEALVSKSDKIRFLSAKGLSVNAIHKLLGIPYQQVRNVVTNPKKRPASIIHVIRLSSDDTEGADTEVATLSENDLIQALKETSE
jgi:hypothetical protein